MSNRVGLTRKRALVLATESPTPPSDRRPNAKAFELLQQQLRVMIQLSVVLGVLLLVLVLLAVCGLLSPMLPR